VTAPQLEIWAGIECTVNRVGNRFLDQVRRTGHDRRLEDLDRIAALGVRVVRYPVLWERVAPDGLASADWRWTDARLGRLRALGLTPIVTLVHHGSGPRATNLLDPAFGARLAEFAAAVARRYPWLEYFTPVNEPLTTARFSALYGHWYPHARDDGSFARALLHQIDAVRRAMAAIRTHIPHARLVQTEDLGRTHATRRLAYQAEFDNARRWLTFDALTGRLDDRHPVWSWLRHAGRLSTRTLRACVGGPLDAPCPPDLVGINHYVTSDRWLDERCERYPARVCGGNGRDRYADVEAVRALQTPPDGVLDALTEAWRRYRIPVAITEAHLGAAAEQQVAWLSDVWRAALAVRRAGGDVRAVTAWSLFGCYDWGSLLTRDDGAYEAGAFDISGGTVVATPLATMIGRLARGDAAPGAAITALGGPPPPGWWTTDARLAYPPADCGVAGCQHGNPLGGRSADCSTDASRAPAAGRPDDVARSRLARTRLALAR